MRNRIIVYSYLASINDLNKHVEYLGLFKDVVKHCICLLSAVSRDYLMSDLEKKIEDEYDLQIPIPVIEAIIKRFISDDEVYVTSDGAIITNEVNLGDFREQIEDSKITIVQLEEDFNGFARENGYEGDLSLYDLVKLYEEKILDLNYEKNGYYEELKIHFEYLKYIQNDVSKKKVFQNVILGTLIARSVLMSN